MPENLLLQAQLEYVEKQVSDIKRLIAEQKLSELGFEPKCPQCKVSVIRPNCAQNLDYCPRHAVIEEFGGQPLLWKRIWQLRKSKSIHGRQ